MAPTSSGLMAAVARPDMAMVAPMRPRTVTG
jgi:hypothetical protein